MAYIALDQLRVASPCQSAEWADLKGGDDHSRLCTTCDKYVYNLSLMTLDEANELIHAKEGKLCISLYRRFDGTVLTADCPVGLRSLRRQYLKTRAKAVGLALSIWAFFTGSMVSCFGTVNGVFPEARTNFAADEKDTTGEWVWRPQSTVTAVNDTTVNEILIAGKSADNTSLWIMLDSTERAPGTYENHRGLYPAGGYYDGRDTNYWYAGELVINSVSSTYASGTFWFNAKDSLGRDSISISSGEFNVAIDYGSIRH